MKLSKPLIPINYRERNEQTPSRLCLLGGQQGFGLVHHLLEKLLHHVGERLDLLVEVVGQRLDVAVEVVGQRSDVLLDVGDVGFDLLLQLGGLGLDLLHQRLDLSPAVSTEERVKPINIISVLV